MMRVTTAWFFGAVLATACASGRDKDGATSITTLAGEEDDDGGADDAMLPSDDDDGAPKNDEGSSDGAAPGTVSDTSEPATSTSGDGMGDTSSMTTAAMTSSDSGPPPPPPGPSEACLESCDFEEFCGISTFEQCAPWCDPVDDGGPCDQALEGLYQCLIVLPDCEALWAYYEEPGPKYPCFMQDAAVGAACG